MKSVKHHLMILRCGVVLCALWLIGFAAAKAQEAAWRDPLNLSQSGTANLPYLFQDNSGQLHILWQDPFQRTFFYVNGDGNTWSQPEAITPPFGAALTQTTEAAPLPPIIPTLITDNNNLVHAFWLNNQNQLRYAFAPLDGFALAENWSAVVTVAADVQAFAAAIAPNGTLSILYVVTGDSADSQAGVYFQRSTDGGLTWGSAAALYLSSYFRLLDPSEFHLDITPGTQSATILAVWNDAAQEKLYTAQSNNGGETWGEPLIVDERTATDMADGLAPSQPQLLARQGMIHRVWLAGHEDAVTGSDGRTCALYHSWSDDNGQTWTPRLHLLPDAAACPQTTHLFTDPENNIWLLAISAGEAWLQRWGEGRWGEPQLQTPLIQFTDPQTFRDLRLSCQQPAVSSGQQLIVLGCSGARGQDAWLLSRTLGDAINWLPSVEDNLAEWQAPVLTYEDAAAINPLKLVLDQENQPHLFWIQPRRQTVDNDPDTVFYTEGVIYHTARVNNNWVAAAPVLISPQGSAEELTVATTRDNRLLVVWSNPETGNLLFSQAESQQSFDANQWSSPLPLPVPVAAATAPDIGLMPDGTIVVAYAVPINEKRGIYLTLSHDDGFTWSEPVQVFDGAAANWAMVDQPHLAFTNNNHVHLTWRQQSLPPTNSPLALYYARSADGGQTWGEATPVVTGPITWSAIVGWSTTQVHIVWREFQSGRTTLWHVISSDDGLTLERPGRVVTFEEEPGPTNLTLDEAGQLYLFQITQSANNPVLLLPFVWNQGTWLPDSTLELDLTMIADQEQLYTAISPTGELSLAVTGLLAAGTQNGVWVSGRSFVMPEVTMMPLPTVTPIFLPTVTPSPQPSPTPEPTIAFPTEPEDANNPTIGPMTINSPTDGVIIAVFLSALLVGGVFLWGLRAIRSVK